MTLSTMNEKEIRKKLAEKQRELAELQALHERNKNKNKIDAFIKEFTDRNDLIKLINEKQLNVDDVRLLAAKISVMIFPIYKNFEGEIQRNQAKRAKDNAARKLRRKAKKEDTVINEQLMGEQTVSSAADDLQHGSSAANNMPSASADSTAPGMRTY